MCLFAFGKLFCDFILWLAPNTCGSVMTNGKIFIEVLSYSFGHECSYWVAVGGE